MIACHSGSAKKASWGRTSYEQQHQSTRDNQSGRVMDVYKHRRRRRTLRSVVMTNGVYFSSVRMLTTPNQHHQARPKQKRVCETYRVLMLAQNAPANTAGPRSGSGGMKLHEANKQSEPEARERCLRQQKQETQRSAHHAALGTAVHL